VVHAWFHGCAGPGALPSATDMSTFLIRRSVETAHVADLGQEMASVRTTAVAMTARGQPVKVLHTTYVPGDGASLCVVEADDAATVMEALRRAGATAADVLAVLAL
jgi:hypothetical protein